MDEAEKYKQRLEAIAEKRRLQEEQDRARREMEDERLRLQQLKRKSLRDQWLMEGAPLSPTYLDTLSPFSPSFDFPAQEKDNQIDMCSHIVLQSEGKQSAEEKDKLKEQTEDSQTKAVRLAEAGEAKGEMAQDVVQNGESNAEGLETTEDEVNQSPQMNETPIILPNGSRDFNTNTNPSSLEQSIGSITNGPVCTAEVVISMKLEPGLSLDVSETEPGQVPNVNINEEEEEGTLVMRAECVIVTDEGDDVPEDPTPYEDQHEIAQSEEIPLPKPETCKEGGEDVEGELTEEAAQERFTQPEMSEATEPTTEAEPVPTDAADVQDDIKINGDDCTKDEGQDKQSADPTSAQLQSPRSALEGATMASVPVYSEAQPLTLTPQPEDEAAVSPEGTEAVLTVQDPADMPYQFQEVPLADHKENHRTEAGLGEQEPLLLQSKDQNTQAASAGTNSPVNTETHSPAGANQGEDTETPKRKTCQCCSVM
ncbi:Paralemmin-3 Precursor [Channa argus]|uniref:Paralemmin-3 n=1 Tax=Channa argus TaxID=215402 RepID=A0A6G1PBF8_CHAAH|nr:Paralemmin-3 Precursor [Channa argus]